MFLRLVYLTFLRQKRRKVLAGVSIAMGIAVATAMIAVATDVGDKINRELRSYGANIAVYPEADTLDVRVGGVDLKPATDGAYLDEADLSNIKSIFWRNNIQAFAPFLPVGVNVTVKNAKSESAELVGTYFHKQLRAGKEHFATGVRDLSPWWKVQGSWPNDDSNNVLVGENLASQLRVRIGDAIVIAGRSVTISGILSTGGKEDMQIVGPLALAQSIANRPDAVRSVSVGALTKPEDELARRDPRSMSPAVFDRWYCSPYARAIAYQIQEAVPHSRADLIRQVSQNEGTVLSRIKGLLLLVTIASLLTSSLAVSAAMATTILERRSDVGLMKALGAGNAAVACLFLAEAALLAIVAGLAGFGGGILFARRAGIWIFGSQISVSPVLLPVILTIAVGVTFLGSVASIRKAMRYEPATVLRGDA